MKPTIVHKKKDSRYELISRAKNALRSIGMENKEIFDISIEAQKFSSVDEIKKCLRKHVIILEEV